MIDGLKGSRDGVDWQIGNFYSIALQEKLNQITNKARRERRHCPFLCSGRWPVVVRTESQVPFSFFPLRAKNSTFRLTIRVHHTSACCFRAPVINRQPHRLVYHVQRLFFYTSVSTSKGNLWVSSDPVGSAVVNCICKCQEFCRKKNEQQFNESGTTSVFHLSRDHLAQGLFTNKTNTIFILLFTFDCVFVCVIKMYNQVNTMVGHFGNALGTFFESASFCYR